MSDKEQILRDIIADRALAHQFLFKNRHPNKTPAFHLEIIRDIYSDIKQLLILAFRGSAKSTIAEEATVIEAVLGEFKNKIILGANQTRAVDRLQAIKHEIEHNETLQVLFGDMKGTDCWGHDKIVLSNGVCIQAFGPGQSFRGVKHLDYRPDRLDIDDLEDEENIRDGDARAALRGWLRRVVFPALDPVAKTRMYATPLDPDALPMHLQKSRAWTSRLYPIYRVTPEGDKVPLWPDRYDAEWIENKRLEFEEAGALHEFAQEFLCQPEDQKTKVFTYSMLVSQPRVRSWEAVYAAYDPARSSRAKYSATTGVAVFSWIGRRLVIWRAAAEHWQPDEIVKDILAVDDEYRPIAIGVETTGLAEFVEQPLRHAGALRASPLPIVSLSPPRGGAAKGYSQIEFIKSLQPFFNAGEVTFACDVSSTIRSQFLGFPTGNRDFLNALAYALIMRPGLPVFDGFSHENVAAELPVLRDTPSYFVVNATPQFTTGVLVQFVATGLRVLADWSREGPPGDNLADIVRQASILSGRTLSLLVPPRHFDTYDTIGLRAAAGKIPARIGPTGDPAKGREEIRALMASQFKGMSRLQVSREARWTLNALAGGYARAYQKGTHLSTEPLQNSYAVLMEGLEAFVALGSLYAEPDRDVRYGVAEDGRRFITMSAHTKPPPPLKDQWWR